ncbi:MAG: hypothetical protein KatS3mg087_1352 [Patescibacteria group bacterium]|nr:MAG: hypothetical protein KatS3mg087_1352 [Patescibacteria group bacterium]
MLYLETEQIEVNIHPYIGTKQWVVFGRVIKSSILVNNFDGSCVTFQKMNDAIDFINLLNSIDSIYIK